MDSDVLPYGTLYGNGGADTLDTQDTRPGNDIANGGSGSDSCTAEPPRHSQVLLKAKEEGATTAATPLALAGLPQVPVRPITAYAQDDGRIA